MKTLKDIIIASKIRKGPAHGTTKRGAFWTFVEDEYFAKLRRSGGDGIGENSPDVTHYLDFRHFRDGSVTAVITRDAYHQNGGYSGGGKEQIDASEILGCTTIEDVEIALKGIGRDESVIGSSHNLRPTLHALGLPESAPAPDEVATVL